jgi:hypothetical protein
MVSMVNETVEKMHKAMRIGDIVKSFDFNGIDNCFIIGKVVGIFETNGTFRAKFIKRVWDGQEDKEFKTDYFTAPLQGNCFMDNAKSPRVIVIA